MIPPDNILLMDNPIQTYAWGSRTAIARLMGRKTPSDEPQAEIRMGAHPKASSKVWHSDQWQPLNRLIAQHPLPILGAEVSNRFGGTLPYLFKVLAAGHPLSIQAHPDKRQAREGFQRENHQGIDLDAYNRNYKDDQHKPECLCALTPFWGLCGFRSPAEILDVIKPVWPVEFNKLLIKLTASQNERALRSLFENLMQLGNTATQMLVASVVEKSSLLGQSENAYDWVVRLNAQYPGDIGVLSPFLLNIIKLDPGDAIFLPARQLHAYLDGLGIEIMANSDNVLRGGLTPKHVDVAELISVLDFTPYAPGKLSTRTKSPGETLYDIPADEFVLAEIVIGSEADYLSSQRNGGPDILLCVDGGAEVMEPDAVNGITLAKGHSVFVPASVKEYKIKGDARLFRAGVNC